jgi:tetratricopeptide (TPR) repeat protein
MRNGKTVFLALASCACAACILWPATPRAAESVALDVDDVAVRMQFAYYTADTRALKAAIDQLTSNADASTADPSRSYYRAYGEWKLAELTANDKRASAQAAKACETDAAAAADATFAIEESDALQGACISMQKSIDITGKAGRLMERAMTLNAKNPRVLLISALYTAEPRSTTSHGRCDRLQRAAQSYDAPSASSPGAPDWGHAEALARWGQCLSAAGDRKTARDVIEKALVIAPDYKWASKLLEANAQT